MYFLGGGGFQVTTLNYGLFVSGPKYYNVTELEHCFYPYGFNVTLTNYIFHRSIPPSLGGEEEVAQKLVYNLSLCLLFLSKTKMIVLGFSLLSVKTEIRNVQTSFIKVNDEK